MERIAGMPQVVATEAKAAFDINLRRASYFLDIHEEATPKRGAPTLRFRELPRGAVVFAVGALDAYLSEISAQVIVHRVSTANAPSDVRDILKRVQSEIPTLAIEVTLLRSLAARKQRIVDAIADHFYNNVSNYGARGVSATVQRLGAKPADLWARLGSRGLANAQSELDFWADLRHQIVHQGKKPKLRRVRARDCIALAGAVVKELDAMAVDAMKSA